MTREELEIERDLAERDLRQAVLTLAACAAERTGHDPDRLAAELLARLGLSPAGRA